MVKQLVKMCTGIFRGATGALADSYVYARHDMRRDSRGSDVHVEIICVKISPHGKQWGFSRLGLSKQFRLLRAGLHQAVSCDELQD